MDNSANQVAPKKKTFWRMIKTIFLPAQAVGKLMIGCGSGKRKGKRRAQLSKMKEIRNNRNSLADIGPPLFRPCPRHPAPFTRSDVSIYSPVNSSLPLPTAPPLSTNGNGSSDDSDSIILALSTSPPQGLREISVANTIGGDGLTLPTPLNLEEAEIYLESLTLRNSENLPQVEETEIRRLVSVEIENNTLNRNIEDDFSEDEEIDRNNLPFGDENHQGESESRINRNYAISSVDLIQNDDNHDEERDAGVRMRRSRTSASLSANVNNYRSNEEDFHGWRKSSIEISPNPPVTLAFVPSGLCLGDRVVWVRDEQPEIGTVRWMGKIRSQFYAGIEFDKPVGNSSGIYGYGFGLYKRLFTCKLPYGRFIPVEELILYKDYHDTGVKSGIVCIICRDDFLDTDFTLETENYFEDVNRNGNGGGIPTFNMVSTKCGHLFHNFCLETWFSTKKKSEYHCPYCLKPMGRNDVIRIFPSQL